MKEEMYKCKYCLAGDECPLYDESNEVCPIKDYVESIDGDRQ